MLRTLMRSQHAGAKETEQDRKRDSTRVFTLDHRSLFGFGKIYGSDSDNGDNGDNHDNDNDSLLKIYT